MGRVTAIYGVGGEGKTTIAQQLATACATGKQWLGLPARECPSLFIACEDDLDELHRRQDDINRFLGCDYLDIGGMGWLPRLGFDNALMSYEGGKPRHTEFFQQILAAAKERDAKLLIFDTLADIYGIASENDRALARVFAQSALGHLARKLSAAVVVLAHPSRAGANSGSGESGSTAWLGTFRSQLFLASPKPEGDETVDADLRELTRKKSNAARRDERIELRWRDGVFVSQRQPAGIFGTIERRAAEGVFLNLLDRLTEQKRPVSDNARSANYAPRIFAQQPDNDGYRQGDFARAMERLFAQREICLVDYLGAGRHNHKRIGRVESD